MSVSLFNPFENTFSDKRYALYEEYLEQDPIHFGVAASPKVPGSWYVFRYDDIVAVLKDSRFTRKSPFSIDADSQPPLPAEQSTLWSLTTQWMLLSDPPAHTQYRNIFQKALNAHLNDALYLRIKDIAESLVSDLQDTKDFDLITDFALPLPLAVISEIVGIPESHRNELKRWSQDIFLAVDLKADTAMYQKAAVAATEVVDLLQELVAHKRRFPANDIISAIVSSDTGRKLSDEELIANFSLLLFAGHETTTGLIGNGVLALLQDRAQWQMLCEDSDLIESCTSEILRYDSPVQVTTRYAQADVSFAGRKIRKGELLCLMFGAGNRDPRRFTEPKIFDVTRPTGRHLGFGYGPHYCIGSVLGDMEGQIALQALMRGLPDLQLQTAQTNWHHSVSMRVLRSLPVSSC